MRLLSLLPSVPALADAGAKMRNEALMRLAADLGHDVDAISFGEPEQEAHLATLAQKTAVVAPPESATAMHRSLRLAQSDLPDMALRLWSPEFQARVDEFLAAGRYDVVQAEGIEMARYLGLANGRGNSYAPALVYDAHNAEALLQRRAFETAAGAGSTLERLAARAYSRIQWQRLTRYERALVRNTHLTLAVSNHDANQLESLSPDRSNVWVVPNGVALDRYPFRAPHDQQGNEPTLLFMGKLDYRPNADALRWLIEEVLPAVFVRMSTARLFVVGANPPDWLVAAGQRDDRIAVVGPVDDERPYLERATVLALPMRVGGGSRLKALVALASGVPIISSRLGVEGLEIEPGVDYLGAETPVEWAEAVACLSASLDRRASLVSHGRATVESNYSAPVLRSRLEAAYASLSR